MRTKEQIIETLCNIVSNVWLKIDPEAKTSCDCFCGENRLFESHFRNEGLAIDFILEAVNEKLEKLGHEPIVFEELE